MAKKFDVEKVSPAQTASGMRLPAAEARNRTEFLLSHHPAKWSWSQRHKRFLPNLDRHPLDPGCQGVELVRGQIVINKLRAGLVASGRIILEPNDPRLPSPYLARTRTDGRDGDGRDIYAYFPVWMAPEIAAGQVEWVIDQEAYEDYLVKLLETGLIPAIDPAVQRRLVRKIERRLDRVNDALADHPLSTKLQRRVRFSAELITQITGKRPEVTFDILRESGTSGRDRSNDAETSGIDGRAAERTGGPTDSGKGGAAAGRRGKGSETPSDAPKAEVSSEEPAAK